MNRFVKKVFAATTLESKLARRGSCNRRTPGGFAVGFFLILLIVPFLISARSMRGQAAAAAPQLQFSSSDQQLVRAFDWARKQALAYAFAGDPVGLWYEAALPGRDAFCMRDVSHQSMGAQALGLSAYTYNLLHHFAAGISASRDWCSYWEINRENQPAPVDYANDTAFWYNLPANFDVLAEVQHHPPCAVEEASHYAEILYRYGEPEAGYSVILDLASPGHCRQEYPEVSYSEIGAITTGVMGVSIVPGLEREVETLPGLTAKTAWAEMRNLSIGRNLVVIRHEGIHQSTFTNLSGPALIWRAAFPGIHRELLVGGKRMEAHAEKHSGIAVSWIQVPLGAGNTVQVSTP